MRYVNGQGLTCYTCDRPIKDQDVYYNSALPSDLRYICATCLTKKLDDGSLILTVPDVPTGSIVCSDCGAVITNEESRYCQSCFDANYASGEENASSYCGDCGTGDDTVYCYTCAKSNWDLIDSGDAADAVECDRCGNRAEYHTCEEHNIIECDSCSEGADFRFCEIHMSVHDEQLGSAERGLQIARAADGIEVQWD